MDQALKGAACRTSGASSGVRGTRALGPRCGADLLCCCFFSFLYWCLSCPCFSVSSSSSSWSSSACFCSCFSSSSSSSAPPLPPSSCRSCCLQDLYSQVLKASPHKDHKALLCFRKQLLHQAAVCQVRELLRQRGFLGFSVFVFVRYIGLSEACVGLGPQIVPSGCVEVSALDITPLSGLEVQTAADQREGPWAPK